MKETVGDRVRMIREARREKQPEFAQTLNRAARRLRVDQHYDNSKVSKMESGARNVALEDVPVLAAVDPLERGKLWLAWGEEAGELHDRAREATTVRPAAEIPMDYGEPITTDQRPARRADTPGKRAAGGDRRR